MSRKLFPVSIVASAVALTLAGGDVLALGLGGLRVQSALNQPFVGEIDLLDVKPDELDTVKIQLASPDEFTSVGLRRYHYLTKLKFSPQISPRGDTVIRISSREPMREPYLDFLIETVWPQGRLVREYTVLLDPPVTSRGRPRSYAAPVASRPRPRYVASSPQRSAPQRVATAPAPATYEPGYPLSIGPVPRGAGLWRLAVRNTPPGATVAQTAMALYRNNQDAFIRGDINRLLVGKTLTIPSSAELHALGPEAAQREFEAALRGESVRRAPIVPVPGEGAHLTIAGATEPRSAPSPAAPAMSPEQAMAGREMEQELLLAREASESARQETSELRSRIRDLESQLAEIQKLLQLRNAELARIQGTEVPAAAEPAPLEEAPTEPAPLPPELAEAIAAVEESVEAEAEAEVEAEAEAAGPETPEGQPLPGEEALAEEPTGPSEVVEVAGVETGTEEVVATTEEVETGTEGVVVATEEVETGPEAAETGTEEVEETSIEETVSAKPEVSAPSEPKPAVVPGPTASTGEPAGQGSSWQTLLLPASGLAGLAAFGIGIFAWLRSRRRREEEQPVLESSSVFGEDSPFGTGAPSSASAPASDSRDLGAAGEVPSSSLADIARTEMATDETDVISEADIYIAYGRYREAEDLLTEEIAHSPNRLDLKFKLAEAYVGSRKHADLTSLLEEMRAAGAEEENPEQWKRLVETAARASGGTSQDTLSGPAQTHTAHPGATVDLSSPEALSLDISDAGHPAMELGSEHVSEPRSGFGDRTSEQARYSAPASSSAAASGRVDIGSEELSSPLDLEIDSQQLDIGFEEPSAPSSASASRVDKKAGGGELPMSTDLDMGAVPGASELNIDSLFDSRDAETMEIESLIAPDAIMPSDVGSAPLRPVESTDIPQQTPVTDQPVTGIDAESPSSDLLSSQWQMDSGLWDETATKLDLARAYVEMGDSDSARGILEEVVAEGNEEQREEAKALLGKIG